MGCQVKGTLSPSQVDTDTLAPHLSPLGFGRYLLWPYLHSPNVYWIPAKCKGLPLWLSGKRICLQMQETQ